MKFKLKGKENQSTSLNSLETMMHHKLFHLRDFNERLKWLNEAIHQMTSYLYKKKHKGNARIIIDIVKELKEERAEIGFKIKELRALKGEPNGRREETGE